MLVILDSQSVKTTEAGGVRGIDGHKKIKGRKRFILVDTQGNVLLTLVFPANLAERWGGEELLEFLAAEYPTVLKVLADQGYRGAWIDEFTQDTNIEIEIVERDPEQKGFVVQKTRWVVERSFAWLNRYRRLSKDYEHFDFNSETWIYIASIHMSLRRLHPNTNLPIPYKSKSKLADSIKSSEVAA
jgi:putative transposase